MTRAVSWARRTCVGASLGVLVGACGGTSPRRAPSFDGMPDLVRDQWLVVAGRALRKESCESGSHLRRCTMGVTRDDCDHVVSVGLRRCTVDWGSTIEPRISAGPMDVTRREQLRGCVWHHVGMELGPRRLDMPCLLTPR
jgi:hypothetical protein